NTQFVADLCAALQRRGANARPVYCYSLRGDAPAVELLRGCDAVITTVLAAGSGTHDGDDWDPSALATLDVPVVQGVAATSAGEAWAASSAGLTPIDVAMQVAIPEFDGRIVTVPFSFKEVVDDGDGLMAEIADNDLAPVDLGHVLVAIQPPRGFGDNPVAVYHSPDLPPAEDYVAFYRWLDETWGAHAIVHVGKHGTLEWLPGKS